MNASRTLGSLSPKGGSERTETDCSLSTLSGRVIFFSLLAADKLIIVGGRVKSPVLVYFGLSCSLRVEQHRSRFLIVLQVLGCS